MQENQMQVRFSALSQNESFARVAVGAFVSQLNPTIGELCDIKTALSEAVTNSIVHGYHLDPQGTVEIRCQLKESEVILQVLDEGTGIEDVPQAMEPFFTTAEQEERSGMGFTVMQTFMDSLEVVSRPGEGTRVLMIKRLGGRP
jgi:stage II sporulation protein AB (anti-sigma F factor)